MRNVFRAANEAGEDAQQATLRVDDLEYEWRQWSNRWHNEATPPEPVYVNENQDMLLLTPAGNAHASGDVHADLLGLDSDALQQWWDASTPQRTDYQSSEPIPAGLQSMLAPGESRVQFSAGGTALRSAPPGIELTTATAVGNLGGRRPEGLIQAGQRSNVGDGPRGDAYRSPDSNLETMQPGVMITSLMNEPVINCDVAYGVLEQRSSDIYSFLTGTRPRTLEQPEVGFGGLYSSFRDTGIVDPAMFQSSASCR